MDEHKERFDSERLEVTGSSRPTWLVILTVAALVLAAIATVYGYNQQVKVTEMNASAAQMSANVRQLQNQVNALTGKLTEMTEAQQRAAEEAAAKQQAQQKSARAGASAASAQRAATDKRFNDLQGKLDDQQKQIKDAQAGLASTNDALAKTRSDLEGGLSSTRSELGSSIARTHEEVMELQRRGERDYFEFDLVKSKSFIRSGPLMLSLRKADTKHKRYDLQMVVDDAELQKKSVNLYEPIWIHSEGAPLPVQVVVNKIDKNRVRGYVSAPKFKAQRNAQAVGSPQASSNQRPPQN